MPRTRPRVPHRLCSVPRGRRFRQARRAPEQPLRLNLKLSDSAGLAGIRRVLAKFIGRPILVCDAAGLTACRGKLFSGDVRAGEPVHGATFVRQRRIVLDSELLMRPRLLQLILLHEIFHLVWVRLGNRKRQEYADLLRSELRNRARGEIGESSWIQKERFLRGRAAGASGAWRDYACESFCDTAAWLYATRSAQTVGDLAGYWRDRRERWFRVSFPEAYRC